MTSDEIATFFKLAINGAEIPDYIIRRIEIEAGKTIAQGIKNYTEEDE